MPIFLYKPEHEDISTDGTERELVPGQIMAEFKRGEESLAQEWRDWLGTNDFPEASCFTEYVGGSQDAFVWCPSKDHMMLHRLAWGGKMAVD